MFCAVHAVKFETGNLLGAIYALLVDIVVYARSVSCYQLSYFCVQNTMTQIL